MFLSVRSSMVSPVASTRWRGGRPPAPTGQMGIMVSFLLVLHWQEGDGFLWFHSGLCKMLLATGVSGCCQSDAPSLQGILWGEEGRGMHKGKMNQRGDEICMCCICDVQYMIWLLHHLLHVLFLSTFTENEALCVCTLVTSKLMVCIVGLCIGNSDAD